MNVQKIPGFDMAVERRVYVETFLDCLKVSLQPALALNVTAVPRSLLVEYLERTAAQAPEAEINALAIRALGHMLPQTGKAMASDLGVSESMRRGCRMADARMMNGESGERSDTAGMDWSRLSTHHSFHSSGGVTV